MLSTYYLFSYLSLGFHLVLVFVRIGTRPSAHVDGSNFSDYGFDLLFGLHPIAQAPTYHEVPAHQLGLNPSIMFQLVTMSSTHHKGSHLLL
jgi:hypothetical protein